MQESPAAIAGIIRAAGRDPEGLSRGVDVSSTITEIDLIPSPANYIALVSAPQ